MTAGVRSVAARIPSSPSANRRITQDTLSHNISHRFANESDNTSRYCTAPKIRRTDMSMLVEELARDRMRQAQRDAEAYRLARRVRHARRQAAKAGR